MDANPLDLAALEIEELTLSKLKAAFKAGMLAAAEIAADIRRCEIEGTGGENTFSSGCRSAAKVIRTAAEEK